MGKEQKNMLGLYIGFFISTLLNFMPYASVQMFGALLFFVILVTTYIYKYKSDKDSFQHTHSKYLIKTIWIFSLALFIGTFLSAMLADNTTINDVMDNALNGIMFTEEELKIMINEYLQKNFFVFLVTISPSFIYFFYRLLKGGKLAQNAQPVTNLKSWL